VKGNRLKRWLQNIDKTEEEEISCSECFDSVSSFVELELSGQDPVSKMPQVKQHLDQCPEEEGDLPSLDDLQDSIP
jgi:hypothetical protein